MSETKRAPSRLEWLPFALFAVLATVYLAVERPDGNLSKFCLFIGAGLIPGMVLRLLGRPSWSTYRVCFAVSLMAFVLNNPTLRPDGETLGKMLDNWPLVVLGFLASFTQPVWGALRAHRLLRDSGVAISKWETFKLSLSGTFFNIFLPGSTGGDAYRVYAIVKNHDARLASAIASISLDRFLGLPALILLVGMGMLLEYDFFRSNRILSGLIPFIAGAAVFCLVFVGYLAFAGKSGREEATTEQPGSRKRPGFFRRIHDMVAQNVKSHATLPLALFYGFLAHMATIASCLLFGIALGVVGVPALRYFLIVPMAMAINAIPGAPGGVGQGELAMATLLDMACPDAGNAQTGVMVMLLFRLSNMALGLVGGIIYATGKTGTAADYAAAAAELQGTTAHGD